MLLQNPFFLVDVRGGLQAADHCVVDLHRLHMGGLGHGDMHCQGQAGHLGLRGGIRFGMGIAPAIGAVDPGDEVVQLLALVGDGLAGGREVQVIGQQAVTAGQDLGLALGGDDGGVGGGIHWAAGK